MRNQLTTAFVVAMMTALGPATVRAAGAPDWKWLVVCDGPNADARRDVVVKALKLLPRLPSRVAVLDVSDARPEVRDVLLGLDGFSLRGSSVVYIVEQSSLLKGALEGSASHVHALAAVIWHEMAHADGADERDARKREEELWTTFVRDQRIDGMLALRYLKALASRPDDQLLALR
jgi:hypothetical protein